MAAGGRSCPVLLAGSGVSSINIVEETRCSLPRSNVEQVEQHGLTVGPLERVLFLDLDHRHRSTLGTQLIAHTCGFLLPGQQLLAGS